MLRQLSTLFISVVVPFVLLITVGTQALTANAGQSAQSEVIQLADGGNNLGGG